ncbi:NmrA family NAD(P)-binding protein [Falsihalocynthiibacter sp. SS001]|uniref:NmrA family NAD(P)-binding protein n=1 Tax=Falsihalocynthiibacter sp. SS001 TaxID=3349698 RepID=UPI0036D42DC8
MNERILVTGATGNVGSEVLDALRSAGHFVVAGVRDPQSVQGPACQIDFEGETEIDGSYRAVFLMRPPHLTDPDLFERFLDAFPRDTLIVFLSVQGAEHQSYIPHAKIERVISEMGFPHVFVRPSYFMENLTTTLWPELKRSNRIYLPAGDLKLDWVSARDITEICAKALTGEITSQAVTVTSGACMGFDEVCQKLNGTLGTTIQYHAASLLGFVRHSRRHGVGWSYVFVMLMLHFLPRFSRDTSAPVDRVHRLLGRPAETIEEFAKRNAETFSKLPR